MSFKRRKLLSMNGMLMSQQTMHSSYYNEKILMHLVEEDYTMQTTYVHNYLIYTFACGYNREKIGSMF
jgi:hypothetical protein